MPGVILVVVGVLLVAAAGILKWVIVPSQTKLPSNLNVNLAINGTYSGINNAALKKGDLANVRLQNAPITFHWSVQAQKSQGDSLLLSDARQIVLNSDGTHLADQAFAYSMDGKTVQLDNTFTGDYSLNFPQVEDRSPTPAAQAVKILNPPPNGVTINFPFSTPKSTLTGYNVYTQQSVPLNYAGNSSLADLTSQNYVGTTPSQRIVAPTALAQLPPAFPKAMIGAVAPLLGVPADVQAKLTAALPTLPNSVPLSYWYTDRSTFNVEPTTGVVLGIDQDQRWSMQIDTKAGPLQLQVLDLHIKPTPSALTVQAKMAKDNINKLDLMGNWVPLAMLVVGVLLLVGGGLLIVRRRPQAAGGAAAAGAMDRPHVPATGRARPAPDHSVTQPPVEVSKEDTAQR